TDNYSYALTDLFVGYGCMYQLCVGDSAVTSRGQTGKVVGVNPYKKTVSLDLDNYTDDYSYPIREVLYGFGCASGTCVGDRAASPNGQTGVVIAISPFNGTVALDLDNYTDNYVYQLSQIFVMNQCLTYSAEVRLSPDPYGRSSFKV